MLGQFERSIASLAIAFMICSCSSAQAPVSPASSASPAIAQASPSASAEAPDLELCRPADVAPAEIRSKPGYAEFAVSVADSSGAPIRGLKQSDFVVQSGPKPDQIVYFLENESSPVSLFVVGDVPNTMAKKTVGKFPLENTRLEIAEAMLNLDGCDEIGVVLAGGTFPPFLGSTLPNTFVSDVKVVQPFTTDQQGALDGIFSIIPFGSSYLSDGLKMATVQLEGAHYARRALVALTDGLDDKAIKNSVPVLEEVRAKGISVWVIGIGDPDAKEGIRSFMTGTTRVDASAVKRLAAAGGGLSLFAAPVSSDEGSSLARAITTIAKGIGHGYTIGVIAQPGAEPKLAIGNLPSAIVSARTVPPQLLAAMAALPAPIA